MHTNKNKTLSPLPWKAVPALKCPDRIVVVDADGKPVAVAEDVALDLHFGWWPLNPANVAYIVEAVNVHEALVSALKGLEYKKEPGVFCDHPVEPCPRCEAARKVLALVAKESKP